MTREEYKADAKALIDDLFRKIDDLEQRKNGMRDELRAQIEQQLIELRKQQQELHNRFDNLAEASTDSWEEIRAAFSKSADNFKVAIAKISGNFK